MAIYFLIMEREKLSESFKYYRIFHVTTQYILNKHEPLACCKEYITKKCTHTHTYI